jgi:hypothetical protein
MDTYETVTDGMGSFLVRVARSDGKVFLTSPTLPTLSDTRKWIEEHRKDAAKLEDS